MKDYYKALEVSAKATQDEIKKSYRRLVLKYHPDRTFDDKEAEIKFKEVQEAYDILCDITKRGNYDDLIRQKHDGQNSAGKANRTDPDKHQKSSSKITPDILLFLFQEIRRTVEVVERKQIKQEVLFGKLDELLNKSYIDFLLAVGNTKINAQIIDEALRCCKPLRTRFVKRLMPKLAQLASTNNEKIQAIYKFEKQHRFISYWFRYRGTAAFLGAAVLLSIFIVEPV